MKKRQSKTSRTDEKWLHSACAMCTAAPMQVKVRDGKIVDVKGEDIIGFDGRVCGKAIAGIGSRVYGPDRILYPLKRVGQRGEGKFTRCTWEEVIDATVAKLKEYIDAGHPEHFEIWWGCPHETDNIFFLHYWAAITKAGISHLHGQVCFGDNAVEKMLTFGANHGPSGLWAGVADWPRTRYAILVGQNFPATGGEAGAGCKVPTYPLANKAKENGCKFVSIDPKLADSTPWCDEWIPIAPGGDALFALHLVNVLIQENLYNEDFLLSYTNAPQLIREDNGQALRDHEGRYLVWNVAAKSAMPLPEAGKADGLTLGLNETYQVAIDGEQITCKTAFHRLIEEANKYTIEDPFLARKAIEVARNLGNYKPSVILFPGFTSGRYSNWFQTLRAYSVVNLLLGNFEQPGGFYFIKNKLNYGNGWPEPPEVPEYRAELELVRASAGNLMSRKNIDKQSCYSEPPEFHPATLSLPWLHFEAIEQGKVKAVLSTAENTAVSQPNLKWVWECLDKLELIIVGEQLPKEFVDLADYVLPEASYLERYHLYHTTYIGTDDKEHLMTYMRAAAIPPQGDSRPLSWFLVEVARKLGLREYFEKLDLQYSWWDRMLEKAGLSSKVSAKKLVEDGPYIEDHPMSYNLLFTPITTCSGRFEIYSNQLAEECYYNPESRWQSNRHVYPLPIYIPIAEPKGNDEFYLLCGKAGWHQKSATQQNRYLMEYAIEGDCAYTAIHINADRARKLGIQDGDLVEVECIGPTKADDPCVLNDAVIGTKEVARAKVTEGLHPKAVWVYFAGGHRSHSMLSKAKEGITHNWFVPTIVTPYAAGLGKNYSMVKVRKID